MNLQLVRGDGDAGSPGDTCGSAGGRTKAGKPCTRAAGWGTTRSEGPCKAHVHTLEPREGVPPPPRHLSPESAALWREVTERYVFGVEGLPLLQAALEARDRAAEARAVLERDGLTFTTRKTGTVHAHPLVKVERDALREFRLTWAALDLDIAPPLED